MPAAVMALSPDDIERLVKLLRMLGSSFDGERAVAGAKIHELVSSKNADLQDLLAPKPSQAVAVVSAGPRTWTVVCEILLEKHFNVLRLPKELEFVSGLLSKGFAPTERQGHWLADICRRAGEPLWGVPAP
jgi:hypothetical protein